MVIQDLLQLTINRKASDLHLVAGYGPVIRVDGQLSNVDYPTLSGQQITALLSPLLSSEQQETFKANHELDFGYSFGEGRFRVNAYFQKGLPSVAFRLIPLRIKSVEELNLPSICHNFATLPQGFVLVTGPTGHGKSTTIAAIIEEINQKRGGHILTIEDPIEYLYSPAKGLVSQREIGSDTYSWGQALRAALREDPNVVLVGEMRDYETIAAALTIAETGHLVFATLHTNSAAQTVDRIVDVFPDNQQAQVRLQLSNSLEAIISQRLLPAIGGGRVPAVEILTATPAVRSVIREGKTHLIDNIVQTSGDAGMMTADLALARLVATGKIDFDMAAAYATNAQEMRSLVQKG
ncbi:MAG: type IV pilus twitching motility protein PilT [Patescibacteria group bacterium]|nr:type IV pilus twitching motility protein PilT [Patescibacteria group bacterium]MCL5432091.1 type IV pilus twitching motility protein PilT [Patescibacteria group bacterium]